MTRWLVVAALVACSQPKPQPAAPPQVSQCARVSDHLVSLMSGAAKHSPEATDPLRRIIEERCDKDRWSADANKCLLELASLADGERCQTMMTPAQIEAFQRDSEAATVELRGQLKEEPQPPAQAPPSDAQPME
jgi:hypothetical protein